MLLKISVEWAEGFSRGSKGTELNAKKKKKGKRKKKEKEKAAVKSSRLERD